MPPSAEQARGPLAEAERLAAVRDAVRAGEGGGELQRLVRMAARALHVPVAVVSWIDADREVVQAAVGLSEPWASSRSVPLTHSLCAEVVHLDGPVVLFDARADPVYRRHPAVAEMGVGAYAGYPLRHGEHTLGAFCAVDFAPRRWSVEDLLLLEDLAAVVSAQLALRATARELEASRGQVRALTRRLHEQSRTDPVTGAANHRRFEERAAEEVARLERGPGDLALTLIDVDRLERITDIAGRGAGDAVLAEVAARVEVALRRTDLLARLGGDEFAVLLPGTDLRSAEQLARRLRRVVREEPVAGWEVTVTTGAAAYEPGGGVERMRAEADAALHAGERTGEDPGAAGPDEHAGPGGGA
ncbi:diguanylate cyclase [Kineococcus sp. T90]|nr:diguanylate cyclase [Kineococcus indalonis]